MMFGRSFRLSDGTLIVSCEFCGTPVWPEAAQATQAALRLIFRGTVDGEVVFYELTSGGPPEDSHMCPGLLQALTEEFEQRDRDSWKDAS